LRNCANRTRHACRSNNSGCRWGRYTECELDNPVGSRTTTAAANVSRLHTVGVLFRDISCTDYWRPFDQDAVEMVSFPAIVWWWYVYADVAQGFFTSTFHSVPSDWSLFQSGYVTKKQLYQTTWLLPRQACGSHFQTPTSKG
jgi:hypothetical protein